MQQYLTSNMLSTVRIGFVLTLLCAAYQNAKAQNVVCDDDGWCCNEERCIKAYCADQPVSWNQARYTCADMDYQLASTPHLADHLAAVGAAVQADCEEGDDDPEDDFWIGLTSGGNYTGDQTCPCWEWLDGSKFVMDETMWQRENPDYNGPCVVLDGGYGYRWRDKTCDSDTKGGYLCQKKGEHYLHESKDMFGMGCFHASALVRVEGREEPVEIRAVEAGDKVLSVSEEGRAWYDEVYSVAHRDLRAPASFVEVEVVPGDGAGAVTTRVTPAHHLITADGGFQAAESVPVGAQMLVYSGGRVVAGSVRRVTPARAGRGVVNVFTKSGRILVGDILAGEYVAPYPARAAHAALYPARMAAAATGRPLPTAGDQGAVPAWLQWMVHVGEMVRASY